MKILNFGSINIDHVYEVDHFVRPGETLGSSGYKIFAGGKGFNQSIALARAGATVFHAGKVGRDGVWLLQRLSLDGVDTSAVSVADIATGHAVIQVVPAGENAIFLYGGSNQALAEMDVVKALTRFSSGDYLLLQNETSVVADAIRKGKEQGLCVVFNPAPMSPVVQTYPLDLVDLFILNETEAGELTGETDTEKIRTAMRRRFPHSATVLTLGGKGAVYFDAVAEFYEKALRVEPVDTTAAGDTFIGFFLAEWVQTGDPARALAVGCRAAAICVTRPGASDSIPRAGELE